MKGFALGLSLSIAFIVGCMAAPMVTGRSNAQVPPRTAQQMADGILRWQYTCYLDRARRPDIVRLNEYGAEGWELTGGRSTVAEFCFKRPL